MRSGDVRSDEVMSDDVRTMADLARLAGVSTSTVSRALNRHVAIPEATRQRILELAEKHQYRIDARGRNLRLGTTRTLAALLPKSVGSGRRMSDPFYLEILSGITQELAGHGYDLLISQAGHDTGAYARYVREKRADGLLVLERDTGEGGVRLLQRAGVPFVVWGPVLPGQDYVSVGGDALRGARLAARHLLAMGRRRIAFIGGERTMIESALRLRGFREALAEAGLELDPARTLFTDDTPRQARAAVTELLTLAGDSDAIFFCSDYLAVTAMEVLKERGRIVPDDVAVIGYDDVPLARQATPKLTTIRQEIHAGGRLMGRKLIESLAGGAPEPELLPVRLVLRDSAP